MDMNMTAQSPVRHAKEGPFCMPLSEALDQIDRTFGIEKILADEGRDILRPYYIQSEPGYKRAHSQEGCMHVALNADGHFDADGYFTQIREVAAQIRATGARKVLELGSGMGFNTLSLAPDFQGVSFTGLDLMEHHVETARGKAKNLKNARFVQGSYDAIPTNLHGADIVFGIETLCYATDLDLVAQNIAKALARGGRFVMYDGFRRPEMDRADPDVVLATRLFEVTTAVTSGFGTLAGWEAALTRAGLRVTRIEDLTDDCIPCMRVLQVRSARFYRSWKYKWLRHFLPRYLILNAVAGLTGPYMIEGATPNTGNSGGCLTYNLMIAEKPS
jgi:SAM-dependent methyltransferase